jgi:hypothetical protein
MIRTILLASCAITIACTPQKSPAGTLNSQGQQGLTTYWGVKIGFKTYFGGADAYCNATGYASWGLPYPISSNYFPSLIFSYMDPYYQSSTSMTLARQASARSTNCGIVPTTLAQGGGFDFAAANYPTAGEDPAVTSERANGGNTPLDVLPDWNPKTGFAAWMNARPNLEPIDATGHVLGTPNGTSSFSPAPWGYPSPATPLAKADCASGGLPTGCNFGMALAAALANDAGEDGVIGLVTSDFGYGGFSEQGTYDNDFNPLVVQAFVAATGTAVPSGSTASQATWIKANAYLAWNDWWAGQWASFFAEYASGVKAKTGQTALIFAAGHDSVQFLRYFGVDARVMAKQGLSDSAIINWDVQEDLAGRNCTGMTIGWVGPILSAAREVTIRNGEYMNAIGGINTGPGAGPSAAMAACYPNQSASQQLQTATGLVSGMWLDREFSTVLDQYGHPRRGPAYENLDHFDSGTIPAWLSNLITTQDPGPTAVGPAIYWSEDLERRSEVIQPVPNSSYYTLGSPGGVNPTEAVRSAIAIDYAISDETVGTITSSSPAKPTCFISIGPGALQLSPTELATLRAIAPVYQIRTDSIADLNADLAVAKAGCPQPVTFPSTNRGDLVPLASGKTLLWVQPVNISTTAGATSGSIQVRTLSNGTHTITELPTGKVGSLTVSNGVGTVAFSLAPYQVDAWIID